MFNYMIASSPTRIMHENARLSNNYPKFIKDTEKILLYLKSLNYDELQDIIDCNNVSLTKHYKNYQEMNLHDAKSAALLTYNGIQFKYMDIASLSQSDLEYLQNHLRILSAFYGILKPFDNIHTYRLDFRKRMPGFIAESLYDFWQDKVFNELYKDVDVVINLTSKEYSKLIKKHLNLQKTTINIKFLDHSGKEIVVYSKIAKGLMIKYLVKKRIQSIEDIKKFSENGYVYSDTYSNGNNFVFINTNK